MERALPIEIIAYAPTAFFHCMHCEVALREVDAGQSIQVEQVKSSLPQELIDEYQAISDWVREVLHQHGDKVWIKVIDAASIEGFLKSLRYRVRDYPAIIIDGKTRFVGGALQEAAGEIDRLIGMHEFSTV